MATNNDELVNVEEEIVKGEQDDVLEKYPRSKKERIQKKPRSKALKMKHDVPQVTVISGSLRIEELARPTKLRALMTLKEKISILSPAFVNNLIRIIEAESCLTPEEAALTLRRKKRERKKITPFSPLMKKWVKEITEDIAHTTMLDKDATMCQYLMAAHFVKSILRHQCELQKKDIHEIAAVIFKRLTSLDGYTTDVQNGDRATQQMRFLANIVACWIAEILIEVAEIHEETLEEYLKKRQMKMIEVNDNNLNSENEDWKQIDQEKDKKEKEQIENKSKEQEKIKQLNDEVKTENGENIGQEEEKAIEQEEEKAIEQEEEKAIEQEEEKAIEQEKETNPLNNPRNNPNTENEDLKQIDQGKDKEEKKQIEDKEQEEKTNLLNEEMKKDEENIKEKQKNGENIDQEEEEKAKEQKEETNPSNNPMNNPNNKNEDGKQIDKDEEKEEIEGKAEKQEEKTEQLMEK
ncbi:uncharacterized protein [Anoplolepis gracilipes]|uniref:uncharacterized protein isoform X2 n=1 Tax=Anoplolepis gracilipes TaxID=354296 RepID=UPI003BA0D5A5